MLNPLITASDWNLFLDYMQLYRENNSRSQGDLYPNISRSDETLHRYINTTTSTTPSSSSMNMDEGISAQTARSSIKNRVIQTVIDLVVIIIIFVVFIIVYTTMDPKIRYFTCNESDIFFPFKPDTVPFWAVGLYGTLGPILFIIAIELLNARVLPFQHNEGITSKQRWRKYFVCLFHGVSLFVLGIALTMCLTEIGKRWVKKKTLAVLP